MGPNENIGYLIQHVSSALSRQSDQVLLERLGIGFSQFKILMSLQWHPHVQQKHIAEKLGQTEASISRQIKLMHEMGLLQTTINPKNRREHLTTPTNKGLRLVEEAMNVLNAYHQPMFERLSTKQREQLLEILKDMHSSVCQPGKIGACHHFAKSLGG